MAKYRNASNTILINGKYSVIITWIKPPTGPEAVVGVMDKPCRRFQTPAAVKLNEHLITDGKIP